MRLKASILNIPIDIATMSQSLAYIEQFIAQKSGGHMVVTANAEMVMLAQKDYELKKILSDADLVVPDGAGVVWAARHLGFNMPERVAGYDLVEQLFSRAAARGYRIYLLGAAPGVADKAKVNAESRYPGLQIVGIRNGFFSVDDEDDIVKHIIQCQPDILLVALGVPKQEKWLARNLEKLCVPVSVGVGGTFDVMAGIMTRAPVWMQQANLEWLFRLARQPQRAARMMALPYFVIRVIASKKC